MTWNGVRPVAHLLDAVYQKGVKLTKEAMKIYEDRIERSDNLPIWDVTIKQTGFWVNYFWVNYLLCVL
jgi:hypothetical protein